MSLTFSNLIYISLLLIALGNGCLRACIASLGGYQFKIPQQKPMLDRYFAQYYFFYYVGILMGKIIPAYVRTEVQITPYCHPDEECYPAVFGLITLVFIVSWIIFLIGWPLYKREYATGNNTMLRTIGCISYAIYRKIIGKSRGINWLQGSVGKYPEEFVNDVSTFLKVIMLFTPMPVYYALLVQQDSSWTFQATDTNTNIGGVEIAADQFKAIGPVLMLIQIPIWQKIVIPLLERKGFHLTSLESVSIGGLCAAFAYVWAGFLQHGIFAHPNDPPSVMWQLPMFFLLMMGEILVSVPGLKFCYSNAPASMKSVLTAVWFLNNALGNLIVVIFNQLRLIENRSHEFFFYAFLMFVATIVFQLLAERFQRSSLDKNLYEEQTIEAFIYEDGMQSSNMEENFINSSDDEREPLVVY
jgi:dipeptide/tripeptide permease